MLGSNQSGAVEQTLPIDEIYSAIESASSLIGADPRGSALMQAVAPNKAKPPPQSRSFCSASAVSFCDFFGERAGSAEHR